jgi:hypothetical protein
MRPSPRHQARHASAQRHAVVHVLRPAVCVSALRSYNRIDVITRTRKLYTWRLPRRRNHAAYKNM